MHACVRVCVCAYMCVFVYVCVYVCVVCVCVGPSEASKKLWLAKKKALFLISWCTELTSSVRELAPVVQVEIGLLQVVHTSTELLQLLIHYVLLLTQCQTLAHVTCSTGVVQYTCRIHTYGMECMDAEFVCIHPSVWPCCTCVYVVRMELNKPSQPVSQFREHLVSLSSPPFSLPPSPFLPHAHCVTCAENTKFLEAQFVKEKESAERTRTTQRPVHTKPLIEEVT